MQSVQHHKRPNAAQRTKRSRPGQPSTHRSTQDGEQRDQRRAKTFFYRPDQRPGLAVLLKLSDITEDLLYQGSGF